MACGSQVTFKKLGCKLSVGMPFKDIATSDSILMHTVPAADDAAARLAIKRLQVRRPSSPSSCLPSPRSTSSHVSSSTRHES